MIPQQFHQKLVQMQLEIFNTKNYSHFHITFTLELAYLHFATFCVLLMGAFLHKPSKIEKIKILIMLKKFIFDLVYQNNLTRKILVFRTRFKKETSES